MEPLMKLVATGRRAVRTREAAEVGKKKVEYFRGKDFMKALQDHPDIVRRKCGKALELAGVGGKSEERSGLRESEVEALGQLLLDHHFVYRVAYKPLVPEAQSGAGSEAPTKKWPDRVERMREQKFDKGGFYAVLYESESAKQMRHLYLAGVIAAVLLCCMFPAWPFWAKVGVWYLAVAVIGGFFVMLIFRVIFFALFWILGVDFWIFPNVMDDYAGIIESFQPAYSWDRRKDDISTVMQRFAALVVVAISVHQIGQTHSIQDITEVASGAFFDLLEWGEQKFQALPEATRVVPSLADIERDTAEHGEETTREADHVEGDHPHAPAEDEEVETVEHDEN